MRPAVKSCWIPFFDSIVLRDVICRLRVKRTYHLEHVLDYVVSSTGSYISGRHIHERLLADGAMKGNSAILP